MTLRPAFRPVPALALLLAAAGCQEVPRSYSTSDRGAEVIFRDDFNRSVLGDEWMTTGPGATLDRGALRLADLRNHPVWLRRELPDDLRIEFDAWAESDEGDIKVELAGDGRSYAESASYTATGYVVIFGGWNNSLNVIARRDEHGDDRVTTTEPKVEADRRYHFTITRRGGELRVEVDGQLLAEFSDGAPLVGDGQRHFAFNNWQAPTRFDNLLIYSLE